MEEINMSENNSNFLPDLNDLRLSQDFAARVGTKKILAVVPVRKPDRQWWIRVHPDPNMRFETAIFESKEEGATYLVDRSLWDELQPELIPKTIFTAVNTLGLIFLWPIKMPGPDGRLDDWNSSAMKGAVEGQTQWVRVAANKAEGAYNILYASAPKPDPVWPQATFQELLQIAFKDQFIKTMDHPVIRRLQGKD
jgi:hypothetical protein